MKRIVWGCVFVFWLCGCSVSQTIPEVEYSSEVIIDEEMLTDWEILIPVCQPDTGHLLMNDRTPYQVLVIRNGEISCIDYPDGQSLKEQYPIAGDDEDKSAKKKVTEIYERSENERILEAREQHSILYAFHFSVSRDGYRYTVFENNGGYYIGEEEVVPFYMMIFVIDEATEEPVYAQMICLKNYALYTTDSIVMIEP